MEVKKVLIADDDDDDIEILKEAILNYAPSIKVDIAPNGDKLMSRLSNEPLPDVLILDLHMPCKNGKECLEELRAIELYKDLVIVVYSTTHLSSVQDECLALGADFFLTKPDEIEGMIKFAEEIAKGTFEFSN